ncbi:MAG: Alanine-tRNA ligase [Parcubacteria group bacterium GW2011_GWC1_39_29]|nr:MAG: Alanine-tRNA ligase [Parcubacteria group bacterium GW2011_GWC1_39_29]
MLGNFSFGGYFKKEAIQYGHDFIVKKMGLKIDYVSVFEGDADVPADDDSERFWKEVDPNIVIKKFGRKDNFWGPTGAEGPCGPTTEIYVNGLEIWNIVFNQYYQHADKKLELLKTPGIDTGMGLERLVMVSQGASTIFDTDLLRPIMELIPSMEERKKRIITDHARAVAFMLSDGFRPSNKEAGYVLRRIMRRLVVYAFQAKLETNVILNLFRMIQEIYGSYYPELDVNLIIGEFSTEKDKFDKTLERGMREFDKIEKLDAINSFHLYESFGLPYEIIKEVGGDKAKALNRDNFDEEFRKHQELSRAGAEKKFGGHGIAKGDLTAANEEELATKIKYHTTTHLLQSALRKVLGDGVHQSGSDINLERLRFDFTLDRKMPPEEIKQVEDLVNSAIKQNLIVNSEEMSFDEAIKSGALAFFKLKYPEKVTVYTIGDKNDYFSKEVCGGPHVQHTGEIGSIKIAKEEAVSAGIRRIRIQLTS